MGMLDTDAWIPPPAGAALLLRSIPLRLFDGNMSCDPTHVFYMEDVTEASVRELMEATVERGMLAWVVFPLTGFRL